MLYLCRITGLPCIAIAAILGVSLLSACSTMAGKHAPKFGIQPPKQEPVLVPPKFSPSADDWDSMPRVLAKLRGQLVKAGTGPLTMMRAADRLWDAHHTSALVVLPTRGVDETEEMHQVHNRELAKSIEILNRVADAPEMDDEARAHLLDLTLNLELERDWIQTIATWTRQHDPQSRQAKQLARNIRAPFLPYAPFRTPQKDIRTGTIRDGECFIVVKEIHGVKVRLVPELIPIWVEPWASRRRIVGYKVVWRVEYVPAEFIKKIITCKNRGRLEHSVHKEIVIEPELLEFWRFYPKDP